MAAGGTVVVVVVGMVVVDDDEMEERMKLVSVGYTDPWENPDRVLDDNIAEAEP